jgi:cytochrome c biogenesis protein CcmG/thiol:disulfide interchange protein DsbE
MPARGKLVLQLGAVCVIGLLIALLGWRVASRSEAQNIALKAEKGEKPAAPDFELPRLDGQGEITLSSYRGKAVVLNFWASWCLPCRDEAPLLQEAWERYDDRGLVVLGVDAQDFVGDARRFVERFELTYPNVHDKNGSTLGRFGIAGFPETMFIDAQGRIVAYVAGPVTAETLGSSIELALQP